KELLLVVFDSEMAEAMGLPVWVINLGLLILIALTIVVSLRAVGNILVLAMLVTPAVAVRLWTDRLLVMMGLSVGFGALGGMLGWLISYYTDLGAGGTIVLIVPAWFFLFWLFVPAYGLLRRYVRSVAAASVSPAPTPLASDET